MDYRTILVKALVTRDGPNCHLCGEPFMLEDQKHIDHVIPRALGGHDVMDNLQLSHVGCNLVKNKRAISTLPPSTDSQSAVPFYGPSRSRYKQSTAAQALIACGGNATEAAKALGISRRSFYNWLGDLTGAEVISSYRMTEGNRTKQGG
jgi:DNA-binding NtrC family response regulator